MVSISMSTLKVGGAMEEYLDLSNLYSQLE